MKKYLLIFTVFLFLNSCSSSNEAEVTLYYSVFLKPSCDSKESKRICITESEYNYLKELVSSISSCESLRVKDIDKELRTGFYDGLSSTSSQPNCD